jgi:hypothetical protein
MLGARSLTIFQMKIFEEMKKQLSLACDRKCGRLEVDW